MLATFLGHKAQVSLGDLSFTSVNKCPKFLESIVSNLFVFSVYSNAELFGNFDADNAAVAEEEFNIFHSSRFYILD